MAKKEAGPPRRAPAFRRTVRLMGFTKSSFFEGELSNGAPKCSSRFAPAWRDQVIRF